VGGEPEEGRVWLRLWSSCAAGSLAFALHPGGHVVPPGWTDRVLDWFEGLDRDGG
jgi:polyhydroxybutyrate depolymerase